jgi:hypothetical protein
MRTSSRKTTAAVLREIIGIKVPEWAEILDRSPHSVHDLESGRLKLSPGLAEKINYETGISIKWLLDGKAEAPPVAEFGGEYTKATYEKVQGQKKYFARVEENNLKSDALEFLRTICNILLNANRKRNYHLVAYRIGQSLDELRSEFGQAWDFKSYEKLLTYLLGLWPKVPGLRIGPSPEDERNFCEALAKLAGTMRDRPTAFKPKRKQASKKK